MPPTAADAAHGAADAADRTAVTPPTAAADADADVRRRTAAAKDGVHSAVVRHSAVRPARMTEPNSDGLPD